MSDNDRSPAEDGSFLFDELDEAAGDSAVESALETAEAEVSTQPRDAVETAIMDDVVEYFDAKYDSAALGIPAPEESDIRGSWFDFGYLADYDLVSWRWAERPYSYTAIVYDPDAGEHRYHVSEAVLSEFEQYVRDDLTRIARQVLMHRDIGSEEERGRIFEAELAGVLDDHAAAVPPSPLLRIVHYLKRDFVRYGKIDPLMRDPALEDLSCDGADVPVFVYHSDYRDLETNVTFGEDRLETFVTRLAQRAGKSLTAADPLLDASLPDGSRAQFTFGSDVSLRGSTFTIRRFSEDPFTPTDLINFGTFSLEQMAYLWLLVENDMSVMFAGGTGSGKTTALNAVSYFIPPGRKIVSIEDTPELRLPHENWVRNVTRESATGTREGAITMFDLLESALRQRPEYLLVGEIRANPQVAFTFFQAISTGHTAYTTFHADSAEGAMRRLENEPLNIPREMLGSLDVISIQRQVTVDGKRDRRNHRLVELTPGSEGGVESHTVFGRNPAKDTMEQRARSSHLQEIKYERGWDDDRLRRELALRKEVLEYLRREDISYHHDVGRVIHTFNRQPRRVLEQIRAGKLQPERLSYPWEE